MLLHPFLESIMNDRQSFFLFFKRELHGDYTVKRERLIVAQTHARVKRLSRDGGS